MNSNNEYHTAESFQSNNFGTPSNTPIRNNHIPLFIPAPLNVPRNKKAKAKAKAKKSSTSSSSNERDGGGARALIKKTKRNKPKSNVQTNNLNNFHINNSNNDYRTFTEEKAKIFMRKLLLEFKKYSKENKKLVKKSEKVLTQLLAGNRMSFAEKYPRMKIDLYKTITSYFKKKENTDKKILAKEIEIPDKNYLLRMIELETFFMVPSKKKNRVVEFSKTRLAIYFDLMLKILNHLMAIKLFENNTYVIITEIEECLAYMLNTTDPIEETILNPEKFGILVNQINHQFLDYFRELYQAKTTNFE
jgi:hypothetical protein